MKIKSLLLLCLTMLFIPNNAHSVETCDDEDIVAQDYTECDIMFHQMFNELAHTQHEFESPIQFETSGNHYSVYAFDIIVNINKDIELHVFYDIETDKDQREPLAHINARQGQRDASISLASPIPRLDEYNEYRSGESKSKGHQIYKLIDYFEPVTLYYNKGGFIPKEVELITVNFSETLNFSDIPNKTVVISHSEDLIETRNVFINITAIEQKDEMIKIEYEATAKTLFNTERLVNNRYIQLVQETAPNAFTELEHVRDTRYEDDLDKNTSGIGIRVGDTSKIVKVVKRYDDTSPVILRVIDIPSGEIVYSEDISEYLDQK